MTSLFNTNRSTWSQQQYAWTVATAIIIAMVLMELAFSLTKNYESLAWRMLNLFFLLGAFIWMVFDYTKHRSYTINYFEAFKLCLKTGVYFCLMFFPLLIIALGFDDTDLQRLQLHTAFRSQQEPFEIIGALFVEVPVFIAIASITAAPMVGIGKKNKFL